MTTTAERPGPRRAPAADDLASEVNQLARAAGSEQAQARAEARREREENLRRGTPEVRRRRAARVVALVAVPVALVLTALNLVGFGPQRALEPAPAIADPAIGPRADVRFVAAAVQAFADRRQRLPRQLAEVSADLPAAVSYEPRADGTFRVSAGSGAAAAAWDTAVDGRPGVRR